MGASPITPTLWPPVAPQLHFTFTSRTRTPVRATAVMLPAAARPAPPPDATPSPALPPSPPFATDSRVPCPQRPQHHITALTGLLTGRTRPRCSTWLVFQWKRISACRARAPPRVMGEGQSAEGGGGHQEGRHAHTLGYCWPPLPAPPTTCIQCSSVSTPARSVASKMALKSRGWLGFCTLALCRRSCILAVVAAYPSGCSSAVLLHHAPPKLNPKLLSC